MKVEGSAKIPMYIDAADEEDNKFLLGGCGGDGAGWKCDYKGWTLGLSSGLRIRANSMHTNLVVLRLKARTR